MAAIVALHGNIPEGESREFPVAFSGKLMWRIPGISLDRKQAKIVKINRKANAPAGYPDTIKYGVIPPSRLRSAERCRLKLFLQWF
jgi:hypothetical protein